MFKKTLAPLAITAFVTLSCVVAARAADTAAAMSHQPVGITPGASSLEQIWSDVFPAIRRPRGPGDKPWNQPPAANAYTFNAVVSLDAARHIDVGVSALMSADVGCDFGPNDRNAAEAPAVCPGRIALIADGKIVAVERIPKLCISSMMDNYSERYATTVALAPDHRHVVVVGQRDGRPIRGDFNGVKDCTVSILIPR